MDTVKSGLPPAFCEASPIKVEAVFCYSQLSRSLEAFWKSFHFPMDFSSSVSHNPWVVSPLYGLSSNYVVCLSQSFSLQECFLESVFCLLWACPWHCGHLGPFSPHGSSHSEDMTVFGNLWELWQWGFRSWSEMFWKQVVTHQNQLSTRKEKKCPINRNSASPLAPQPENSV